MDLLATAIGGPFDGMGGSFVGEISCGSLGGEEIKAEETATEGAAKIVIFDGEKDGTSDCGVDETEGVTGSVAFVDTGVGDSTGFWSPSLLCVGDRTFLLLPRNLLRVTLGFKR